MKKIGCPNEGIFLIMKSEQNPQDFTLIIYFEDDFYSFEITYVRKVSYFEIL